MINPARLGRVGYVKVPTTSATLLLGPDPHRTTVAFFSTTAGRFTLSNDPVPVLDLGPTLAANNAWVKFCTEEWGDLPTKAWYVICSTTNLAVGYAEAFDAGGVR